VPAPAAGVATAIVAVLGDDRRDPAYVLEARALVAA
jgi:hypothetical protein